MKILVCVYCGEEVDEDFPACCGEIYHTELEEHLDATFAREDEARLNARVQPK